MKRFSLSIDTRGWIFAWSILLLAMTSRLVVAESPARLIPQYLEAGEFAPALAAARSMENAQLRDQWLGRVAQSQARVGARRAAARTLGEIQSDLARSAAIKGLPAPSLAAAGGAAMADFDTLMELITSTIAPISWEEVGGAGAIESFPTGVYIDPTGLMKQLPPARDRSSLDSRWNQARTDGGNRSVQQTSRLRKVSLPRLEKQLQLRAAFGQRPTEAMRHLAGIYRLDYLLVYPQSGELVLAGPAGNWQTDTEGRIVNAESQLPVLKLDDLVVVLRNTWGPHRGRFGCAIKPQAQGLAAIKKYVDDWQGQSIKPGQRKRWLEDLRKSLGQQKIEFWGIAPTTNAARVIVEADYHMKLIGMGLEEGTLGVTSYLDAAKQARGKNQPSMSVLRWWFTLHEHRLRRTASNQAFAWNGPAARVLSENELLTKTGQRIHTGASDELNREFAHQFTTHFDKLARKYPLYAELQNLFDLALLAAVLQSEDLPAQVDWHLTHFKDSQACPVTSHAVPRTVDSVVNHVMIDRRQLIAGVSGGVAVDTSQLLESNPMKLDDYGKLEAEHAASDPAASQRQADVWWWD